MLSRVDFPLVQAGRHLRQRGEAVAVAHIADGEHGRYRLGSIILTLMNSLSLVTVVPIIMASRVCA